MRVLIVDDHQRFRASARRVLERGGLQVVGEAADGDGALRAARDLRPDCVLLDIGLPGADGYAVAERLAREPEAPAVVLTSSRDPADVLPLDPASPACGFLAKDELSAAALAEAAARRS